ncbi:MAG TPA: hypothetical protein VN364_08150 [Bellilinea sp.]|nr:hypothetical protein [Bellilinea sp.]
MIDLKPAIDAVRVADEKVNRLLDEMNTHLTAGTDEGTQAALDLRPALDEAKAKAADAKSLYETMRDAAALSGNSARAFVPATGTNLSTGDPAKEMTRQDFDALNATEQLKFMRAGGNVTESD